MLDSEIDVTKNIKLKQFFLCSAFIVLGILLIIFVTFLFLNTPPKNFPLNLTLTIERGESVTSIVQKFKDLGYVKSSNLLHAFLIFENNEMTVKAGTYTFTSPLSTAGIASHISTIGPDQQLVKLTFPEGMTVEDFANIADKFLPNFNKVEFVELAQKFEGKLFPDTYFVPETFSETDLIELLNDTYSLKIKNYASDIENHFLLEEGIITLASLIEREANSKESMRMVSGILQNRIEIGMPLQADASIEYILDKPLSEISPEDLKIDSPYNTYLYNGLPPTPIGNPGIDAIEAVLEPEPSDFYYYITDDDGEFHYAKTYNQHLSNIARYLR